MPAPANDNWSSAISLSGASGSTTGNNISSTAEVGEPANNGKTVWYSWTPPTLASPSANTGQCVYFATIQNMLTVPLKTVVRVYTGASVGALTEVTYLTSSKWNQRYGGWDWGSFVAFDAVHGTTYYIRVDGVSGLEGNFPLSWGIFYNTLLGGCSGCPPFLEDDCTCIGTVQLPDATTNSTMSFGSIASGYYLGAFCGGCVLFDLGQNSSGVETFGMYFQVADHLSPSGFDGPTFKWNYFAAGSATSTVFASGGGNQNYPSQASCENANLCTRIPMAHSGGNITIAFQDFPLSDNAQANPNPIFGLYQCPPLSTKSACASWTTPCVAATCTFTIQNNGPAITGITATLNATGGVSSPSAPQTGLSIPNGTSTLTFTFHASTPNVTASLAFTGSAAGLPQTVSVFLGPIFTFTKAFGPAKNAFCGGSNEIIVSIHNIGYWSLTPSFTFSISDAALNFWDDFVSCNNIGNPATVTPGTATNCNGGSVGITLQIKAPASNEAATLSVNIYDACANYGTLSMSVSLLS